MSPWLITVPYGPYNVAYHIDYFVYIYIYGGYLYENVQHRQCWIRLRLSWIPVSTLHKNEPQQSLRSILFPKWIVSVPAPLMVRDDGGKYVAILIWELFVANIKFVVEVSDVDDIYVTFQCGNRLSKSHQTSSNTRH